MNPKTLPLFLIGCIGVRSLFAYISSIVNIEYLPYIGYLALLPVIGWLVLYTFGLRMTGPEVFGGKIWWNKLRPVHALLFLLFAIFAIRKRRDAYYFLIIDTVLGLIAFMYHHYF